MDYNAYIDEMIAKARAAQAIAATYTQEQLDAMCLALAKRFYAESERLAKMAVEETGKGRVESKLGKNQRTAVCSWREMKHQPSTGVYSVDEAKKLTIYAKPIGVVAALQPVTNPTATPCHNSMHALKAGNAIILAPHPQSKKCSTEAANVLRDELAKNGYPVDLIQCIEEPKLELSQLLMQKCDVILATGGENMVKSAYSSGKPSYGVGPGNVQVVVDPNYDDLEKVAVQSLNGRSYDWGMPCTGEQTIHCSEAMYEPLKAEFIKNGAYFVDDEESLEKFRKAFFTEKGGPAPAIVGQSPQKLGEIAGVHIPDDAKLIMFRVHADANSEILEKEILGPVTRFFTFDTFENGCEHALANNKMMGGGHVGVIYSNDDEKIDYYARKCIVGRLVVNQNANAGNGGPDNNGLPHTITLGCGFWGNNSTSDNLIFRHLLNFTRVARVIPGLPAVVPAEEMFAD